MILWVWMIKQLLSLQIVIECLDMNYPGLTQFRRSSAIYSVKIIVFKILPLYIVPLRKSCYQNNWVAQPRFDRRNVFGELLKSPLQKQLLISNPVE